MLHAPPVVNVQRVLNVTLAHAGNLQRLRHARSRRVGCSFAVDLHHGKARGPIQCTVTLYRSRRLRHPVGHYTLDVTLVHRHRDASYEDGSGWRRYSLHRSLAFNPEPPGRAFGRPRYIGG